MDLIQTRHAGMKAWEQNSFSISWTDNHSKTLWGKFARSLLQINTKKYSTWHVPTLLLIVCIIYMYYNLGMCSNRFKRHLKKYIVSKRICKSLTFDD